MEVPKRLQKGGKHMKFTISGKQMTVRPSLKELTEKNKLGDETPAAAETAEAGEKKRKGFGRK